MVARIVGAVWEGLFSEHFKEFAEGKGDNAFHSLEVDTSMMRK